MSNLNIDRNLVTPIQTPKVMSEGEVGAAAGRKLQAILDILLWPSAMQSLQHRTFSQDVHVVVVGDISSSSLRILEMLGPAGTITTFEIDKVLANRLATEIEKSGTEHALKVINGHFTQCPQELNADMVICGTLLANGQEVAEIVRAAGRHLKAGGMLHLEVLDSSRMQSFPSSYALYRYSELLHLYTKALSPSMLNDACLAAQLRPFSLTHAATGFLEQKQLPALVLECIASRLIERALADDLELQAIIAELKHLAEQPASLVSAPGGMRLLALKTADPQSNPEFESLTS